MDWRQLKYLGIGGLLAGISLTWSGCAFQGLEAGCPSPSAGLQVRTLSWKPDWSWRDVDMGHDGNFYFSPEVGDQAFWDDKRIKGDVVLKVTLGGSIERIRSGPEAVHEMAAIVPENPPDSRYSPGYLVVGTGGLWLSDDKHEQLRIMQIDSGFKSETILINRPDKLNTYRPGKEVFSDSSGTVYGRTGCGIFRLGQSPIERLYGENDHAACKLGDYGKPVAVFGPSFFASRFYYDSLLPDGSVYVPGTEVHWPYPDFTTRPKGSEIYRFKDGKAEVWAGAAELGDRDGMRGEARFGWITGMAAARDGTLYVSDSHYHRIRKISPTGEVTTLAGQGKPGSQGGSASSARFDTPGAVVLGNCHKLYVFDRNGVRELSLPPGADSERWGPPPA